MAFCLLAAICGMLTYSFLHITQLMGMSELEDDYLYLTDAELLPRDISFPEASAQGSGWQSVELPFHWRNQFPDTRAVWYRLTVSRSQLASVLGPAAHPGNQLLGMYIWRLNQTADIWFNGSKIGSGGNTEEPMARHWNSPLYFSVPEGLLQEDNVILVKHFAQHSRGSMEAIVLGEEDNLRPIYETRYSIQNDVSLGLFVFVLSTGIFTFMVWFYRREETQYLWFAIASAGLSFYSLNQFIRYLPVGPDSWRWMSNMSTDLWAASLIIFLLRSLNLHRPNVEKTAVAYFLSGIPVYYYASFYQHFDINVYYHIGALLLGIYSLSLCIATYRRTRKTLPLFYIGIIALLFIAGLHDTAMQAIVNVGWQEISGANFQNHFNLVHFSAPAMFLLIAASLIKQFIDSMNESTRLNKVLEARVNQAKNELAENYKAIEETLIYKTTTEERERIYRDLHDDVGSKLLSLYYRLDKESDSTLAKSALADLRDIVSRKPVDSYPLEQAVKEWQHEAEDRVSDAGIPLSWHFESSQSSVTLGELQHAHLRRMLREVLSNAILHGEPVTEIRVTITATDNLLKISVKNDGVKTPVDKWNAGRGLGNLRVRSRDLSGELFINDLEGQWVEILWIVPLISDQGEAT
jgi:signal transduction histidine kinase